MLNPKIKTMCLTVAQEYFNLPGVLAVVVSGSQVGPFADEGSDIDMYVYSNIDLDVSDRQVIVDKLGRNGELNNQFWETGDEWVNNESNLLIDVMFRHTGWAENEITRVIDEYHASVGYSTCILHNIANSVCLFEKQGWFSNLQNRACLEYPDQLQENIFKKNYPLLRTIHASYRVQILKAIDREDTVSVNHRVTAFLASYFDLLFALNKQTHPGEKRLLNWAAHTCHFLPDNMSRDIFNILSINSHPHQARCHIDSLIDEFDALLLKNGFDIGAI